MATAEKPKILSEEKQIESLKRLTDPTYSGPGNWQHMHTKAAQIKNYNNMIETIKDIEFTIENLKCAKCKVHATEYLKNHPIRICLDCKHQNHKGGLQRCLFEWTCDFHNAVNVRLGKPIISSDIAWNFYAEPEFEVCNTDCDGHDGEGTKIDKYESEVKTNTTYFAKSVPFNIQPRRS